MSAKPLTYPGRDRLADLHVIASAVVANLERNDCEYGGWEVDAKRPFGNSDVDADMIEMLGIDRNVCPHCGECVDGSDESARAYVASLYGDVGDHIRTMWAKVQP